jgi:hypothetical protein
MIVIVSVIDPRYIGQPRGGSSRSETCEQGAGVSREIMQSVKSKNGRSDDISGKNGKGLKPFDRLYRPSDREPFMNDRQREYFRLKLLGWREDILKEAK